MSLKGCVEPLNNNFIRGWCYDDSSHSPLLVDIFIDGIFLRRVRADQPRPDLKNLIQRETNVGFSLPLFPLLISKLPKDGLFHVQTAEGVIVPPLLPATMGCGFGGSPDARELREALEGGWVVDKWGDLKLPFKAAPQNKGIFLDLYLKINGLFQAEFGHPLFLCYGSLLGHVREGDLIDFDDDIDCSYISYADDVESAAHYFEKVLKWATEIGPEHGINPLVIGPGQLQLWEGDAHIDLFSSWMTSTGYIYMIFGVGGQMPTNELAVKTGTMLDRTVIVPVEAEALLEATYGPGWRTPDPNFQWSVPEHITQIMESFARSVRGDT